MTTVNGYPVIGRGSIADLTPTEVGQDVMRLRHYGFRHLRIDDDEMVILGNEKDRDWWLERCGLSDELPTNIQE